MNKYEVYTLTHGIIRIDADHYSHRIDTGLVLYVFLTEDRTVAEFTAREVVAIVKINPAQ